MMKHAVPLLGSWILLLTAPAAISEDTAVAGESARKEAMTPKEIVEENFGSIALIEGDAGSGTGLILREGETIRLYTAAHVIAGNSRLTVKNSAGRKFTKFGTFEVAANTDLARIELKEKFDSSVRLAAHDSAKVRDPLLAIGNSGGAGVLTILEGDIMSLGPDSIEVSNKVIQGNSGGPVFSGRTGELLGLVTHATAAREDIWAEDTDFNEVRRFATRLDRRIEWKERNIGQFLKERGRIDTFDRNTRILFAISALYPTQDGLRLDTRVSETGPTVISIIDENKDLPIVAELIEMNIELGNKRMRTSVSDLRRRFARYYHGAVLKLNRDMKTFAPEGFSGYLREEAEQSKEWRLDALKEVKSAEARLK